MLSDMTAVDVKLHWEVGAPFMEECAGFHLGQENFVEKVGEKLN